MDRLYEKLCDLLEEMARKDKLSTSDLQIIDWLTHAKKSMLAIEEMEGSGYSNYGSYNSYREGGNRNGRRNYSNRREGRYSNEGGYSRRYSRDDGREEYVAQLRDMMNNAPDENMRQSISRMIREIEQD